MKVRLRSGVVYGQDMQFHSAFGDILNVVFDAEVITRDSKLRLVAPGYGLLPGQYGCGAVYTYMKDVVEVKEPESNLREENDRLRSENEELRKVLKNACYNKGRECFCGQHGRRSPKP